MTVMETPMRTAKAQQLAKTIMDDLEALISTSIAYEQPGAGLKEWVPRQHRIMTNLALAGVPLNGIKEYAGHSSIVETQRYLKFMPASIELAAMVTSRLAQLTRATADSQPGANAIEDPDDGGPAPPTSRGR